MTDPVARARAFARRAHAGQTRKDAGARPYAVHLAEVAALAGTLGAPAEVVAAAWLHDTLEDCPGVTAALLRRRFGPAIAGIVSEVTDDTTLPRAARKAAQIAAAPGKSPGAALVKLCDKLSNVRSAALTPPLGWSRRRRLDYVDWSEAVVAALPPLPEPARAAFALTLGMARRVIAAGA